MPKPVKIKKAKSFMFTTKHHSFSGVMGCVISCISIAVMSFSIYSAYANAGKSSASIASLALFSLVLDFIGVIAGITSLSERDIHKWVPIVSIVSNSIMLALWVTLVLHGKG